MPAPLPHTGARHCGGDPQVWDCYEHAGPADPPERPRPDARGARVGRRLRGDVLRLGQPAAAQHRQLDGHQQPPARAAGHPRPRRRLPRRPALRQRRRRGRDPSRPAAARPAARRAGRGRAAEPRRAAPPRRCWRARAPSSPGSRPTATPTSCCSRCSRAAGPIVSTNNGVVVLDLKALLAETRGSGSASAAASATRCPPTRPQITILRSDQLERRPGRLPDLLQSLPIVLVSLSLLLFAIALFVSPGWRRKAVRAYGFGFIAAGALGLAADVDPRRQVTRVARPDRGGRARDRRRPGPSRRRCCTRSPSRPSATAS